MRLNPIKTHPSLIANILILGLASLLFSCKSDLEIKKTVFSVDPVNVLRQNVEINTNIDSEVFIEYWEKGSENHFTSGISPSETNHMITVIGLKADTDYILKASAKAIENEQTVISEELEFTTGNLPEFLPEYNLVTSDKNVFIGYVLARKVNYPSSNILLNGSGEIVWYQAGDSSLMNPFTWTDQQTILMLENTDKILEIDLYGNELFSLSYGEKGFEKHLHHEIRKDQNGNILALTREEKIVDLSGLGGQKEDTVKGDGILVLDSQGEKIWSWNIFQVADPLEDEDINKTKLDWSHANALNIDEDGNYLVSYHHFDQVWKIDSKTGELIWKLGKDGDFKMKESDWFYKQHAVHKTKNRDLMLFDNGDVFRVQSRAIKLFIDESAMTAASSLSVFLPDSLFSFKQGSTYEMEDDFIIFSISTKNKIVITDKSGNILWQVNGSDSNYRAYYINDLPKQNFY